MTSNALSGLQPVRRAILRGLAVATPPLLTIVLFLWAWNAIETYVLSPLEAAARHTLVWMQRDVVEPEMAAAPDAQLLRDASGKPQVLRRMGREYLPVGQQWVPRKIVEFVRRHPGESLPTTPDGYYHHYMRSRWLKRSAVLPVFLCLFVLLLYGTGKFVAARIGRAWGKAVENLIIRLPLICNVYSSVKQVTDYIFSEQEEVTYTRVVAVEYPRRGIWSLGFVTGEGMADIRAAANEPILTVLMPTSPMPATGFTVTVRKSDTVELDITMDQAIQFIVSCGVVIPPHQRSSPEGGAAGVVAAGVESQVRAAATAAGTDPTADPVRTSAGDPPPATTSIWTG